MKKIQFKLNKSLTGNRSYFLPALIILLVAGSCKKQLDVKDPNDPTFGLNVTSEAGLANYAKGGIYWNGFNYGDGWLGDSYFSLPWGYHELMGDVVGGGQGSNNQTTTMGVPDKIIADPSDPSTVVVNAAPQVSIIRGFNTAAATANANNALYYEWINMYGMISACNQTLEHVGSINLTADKANTVKAWCYWWRGYAYAQLGTLYYAGVVVNQSNTIVSHFVPHDSLIDASNTDLKLALATLNGISNQGDYGSMITQLIPQQNQVGLGLPLSSAQWIRTINTMLARNILLNKLSPFVKGNTSATISKSSMPAITTADWQQIITLCNAGIKQGDYVFTGRSSSSNSYFSATGGSVAGMVSRTNQNSTYKVSERLVESFKPGDKRLANFDASNGTFYGDANSNTTRYSLVDAVDAGLSGFQTLGSREPGGLEIYIGPTYEENELMLAEANIRTGNIAAGLAGIDKVRQYQGASVPAVAGTITTAGPAMQELAMERMAALAFRGLSFYDSRRWGWTYSIANGGGRYGVTVIFNKKVYTNATIDYNFMDYWDVPADEIDKNPPSDGSAPTINPNY